MARIKGVSNLRAAMRLFVAAIAVASASAHAVVTSFSVFGSFQSATTGLSPYDFVEFGAQFKGVGSNPITPAGSGVSFYSNDSSTARRGEYASGIAPTEAIIYSGLTTAVSPTNLSTVTVALQTSATAIGFYFGSYNYFGTPLKINVTSNNVVTTFGSLTPTSGVTLPANTNPYVFNFIGFTSPSEITQVIFTQPNPNNGLNIHTFSVGSIAAIPEPSIPALFVIGLALIGTIVRRKSR